MKPAPLLFEYQRLVERERGLRGNIERVTSRLESDPEVVEREETLTEARAAQSATAARVRESDHEREAHRTRLRTREKELMSGRIRNPTELMQMSEEVQHMKARFVEEEDAELKLMEEADAADHAVREATEDLEQARRQSVSEEPELRENLRTWSIELAEVETERDAIWEQVPKPAQVAYSRMRMQPAVAQVINGQCAACHVTVTSSGMQMLRKGDELVHCENCGRILVRD
ncbi:MAG TPA: C4-type zinc ribbon domain-containing protein [Candidatus Eisenbacteria bacterium]|nr:C4-type zinc ribbon domain-containing protein [Candidatus Eisenbacteria bacterium]